MTRVKFDVSGSDPEEATRRDLQSRPSAEDMYHLLVSRLLSRNPTRRGSDYICPHHSDKKPSLGVKLKRGSTSEGARVLVLCSAGCSTEDVLADVGMSISDLFGRGRSVAATYKYTDENGASLFEVVRYEPKGFAQRRPLKGGGHAWNLKGVRRVPYRLPAVVKAIAQGLPIYFPEGEKDVHAIENAGGVATTTPGGASGWRDEYAEALSGASEVIVISDVDADNPQKPGPRLAMRKAEALERLGIKTTIVFPKAGNDAADHLAAGCGLDEWNPFVPAPDEDYERRVDRRASDLEVDRDARARLAARGFVFPSYFRSMAEELEAEREPLVFTIRGLHVRGGNTLFVARFKAGKTTLEMNVARSWADGVALFDRYEVRKPPGKRVAFWNYELSDELFDDWFEAMAFDHPERVTALHLRGRGRMPLDDSHVQQEVIAHLKADRIGLWILDGAAKVMSDSGIDSENDNLAVARLTDALDYIKAEAGVDDLILAGHWGRAKVEEGREHIRGATRWDDWADSRWSLGRDPDGTRSFAALDVRGAEVDEPFTLAFDPNTRRLTDAGHTREEYDKRRGAAEVAAVLKRKGPLSATALREELRGDSNLKPQKVQSAEEFGWITRHPNGAGRPTIHKVVRGTKKEWKPFVAYAPHLG